MLFNRFLSLIGGPRFRFAVVTLVAALLLLRGRRTSALMLVTATAGMGAINTGIKAAVRRQRPEGLPGLRQAGGYSFPSGHASGSLVFFGALAYLGWRMTRHPVLTSGTLGAAGILAGGIGNSRVQLRAHHWSDVFGGFAAGLVWLTLVVRLFAG